ncbi:hypothetical protein DL93DRAFT_2152928 [Clavulina sp. PMI_390]|nr:hypothetical protein DL93DRAFT_2152928 [Clavulina sp. PMI_390]
MDLGHWVDRIAILSAEIQDRASYSPNARSNYTDSILSKPLAAYVREAESVESRMFKVSRPPPGEVATSVDLRKVETVNASPLKKAREAPLAILEPQEYVRSVIRLGEKYNVMPRAQAYARDLLEKAEGYEKRIAVLERSLKEGEKMAPPGSARKKGRTLKEEERLTREVEARAASLRDQKRQLLEHLNGAKDATVSDTSVFASPSAIAKQGSMLTANLPDTSELSVVEAPPPKKRTLAQEIQARRAARQANRKPGPTEAAKPPLSSGSTPKESAFWSSDSSPSSSQITNSLTSGSSINVSTEPSDSDLTEESSVPVDAAQEPDAEMDTETGDEDGEADVTVVLPSNGQSSARSTFSLLRRSTITRNAPAVVSSAIEPPPPLSAPIPTTSQSESVVPPPAPTPQDIPGPQSPISEPPRPEEENAPPEVETEMSQSSMDPSTPEVEIQMARVWRTAGEIILPENSYTKSGTTPSTQTTLHIVQSISTLPTKTDDPTGSASEAVLAMLGTHRSQSATSSLPPTHLQVLTASAVLQLLSYVVQNASSPAEDGLVWMPQNALKTELKAHPWAVEAMTNESVDWVAKVMLFSTDERD